METLVDKFERRIDYLRLSVTDRCNLRCIYCMPEEGILQKDPSEILAFEEICRIAGLCVDAGINKIKITGGEPLIRKDLPRLIELLFSLPGLKDLSLTTNGVLLSKFAPLLKKGGLKRINVSIDSLNEEKFRRITRMGSFTAVMDGIDAALKEGLFVKLNVVIMRGVNDDEIFDFARFSRQKKIIVRFIEFMPISKNVLTDLYISCATIKERLEALGSLAPVYDQSFGNGPARYYKIEGVPAIVGFISPISCKFCLDCNRLRLTASGMLMPCLVSNEAFDLKEALRGATESRMLELIRKAVILKPQSHDIGTSGRAQNIVMSQVGG